MRLEIVALANFPEVRPGDDLASLISIAAVSFMIQMGGSLTTIFTTVATNM